MATTARKFDTQNDQELYEAMDHILTTLGAEKGVATLRALFENAHRMMRPLMFQRTK